MVVGWTRMINQRTFRLIAIGLLTVTFAGCEFMSMETVPKPEIIKKWMGDFLIEPDQITGVYRNIDVDSLVFTYKTGVRTRPDFENALSSALQNSKWRQSTNVTEYMEFRRSFQKGETSEDRPDMAIFSSFEVARLAFAPDSRTVVVAYVQADASEKVTCFESTGEGKWADRVIWPKFNELRKRQPPNKADAGDG